MKAQLEGKAQVIYDVQLVLAPDLKLSLHSGAAASCRPSFGAQEYG